MAGIEGIEPSSPGLEAGCLHWRYPRKWYSCQGLNLGPLVPETSALFN